MKDKEDELIERTLRLWQPYYPYQLSREDAREILENVKAYFSLLKEWQEREEMAKSGNGYRNVAVDGQHNVTLGGQKSAKN